MAVNDDDLQSIVASGQQFLKEQYEKQDKTRVPGKAYIQKTTRDGVDYYSQSWWDWTPQDLDPNDTITFIPMPIPMGAGGYYQDASGQRHLKVDVNGLSAWLPVGKEITINRFFYYPYKDALDTYMELERHKVTGPTNAPWGVGKDGGNLWYYEPHGFTFGFSLDGSSLTGAHTEKVEVGEYKGELQYIMMTKQEAIEWYAGKGVAANVNELAIRNNEDLRKRIEMALAVQQEQIKKAQKLVKKPTIMDKMVKRLKRKK